MKSWLGIFVALVGFSAGMFDASLLAQPQPADTQDDPVADAMSEVEEFWPASDILKMAVGNLSKRYNLNDEQRAYTDEMMSTRVSAFLEKHREEVWPLLRDLVLQQQKGGPPDPETAKRIGPAALKVIHEAEEEIYKSNAEWRGILTEDQKKLHDWDLAEMKRTFRVMKDNFEKWEQGHPADATVFPLRRRPANEPRRPSKPKQPGTYHPRPKDDPELDDKFELFVKRFIQDYQLKPDQVNAAHSILREIEERAAAFRLTNAEKIKEVRQKMNQGKVRERRIWNQKRKKLMRPINELYVELTERLKQIPDDAQRDRYRLKAQRRATSSSAISSSKGKRATGQVRERTPAPTQKSPKSSTKDDSE